MDTFAGGSGPSDGVTRSTVPWDLGDVAKGLAVPAFFVSVGLLSVLLDSESDRDYSEGELVVGLGFSLGLQFLLIGAAYWLTMRRRGATWADLGLRRWRGGWWLPAAILGGALAVAYTYAGILEIVNVDAGDVQEEVFDYVAPTVMLGIISIGLAPVIEEVFFRGFVFGAFRGRVRASAAVVISGCIFGAAHLANGSLLVFFPISAIGMIFAWGYLHSGSILPTIIAHFLFNALVFSIGVLAA